MNNSVEKVTKFEFDSWIGRSCILDNSNIS